MCNLLRVNANSMPVVVLQYTVVFNVKTVLVSTRKIKPANYKSLLAFSVWIGLFLNFPKIEPTVSYKMFLIKIISVTVFTTIPSSFFPFSLKPIYFFIVHKSRE